MFLYNLRTDLQTAIKHHPNPELHAALNRLLAIVNRLIQAFEDNADAHPGDNEDPRDITHLNAALQRQHDLLALYAAATNDVEAVRRHLHAPENDPANIVNEMITRFNREMTGLENDANGLIQHHRGAIARHHRDAIARNPHQASRDQHQAAIGRPSGPKF